MDARSTVPAGPAGARRLSLHLLVIGAIAVGLLATSGAAHAQPIDQGQAPAPPSSDQGPRFGNWGPGQQAPAPEGPSEGDAPAPSAPGARPDAAPGAPSTRAPSPYAAPAPGPNPAVPAPPNHWAGCDYDLRGSWQVSGTQTSPNQYPYLARINVRQYQNWLQIDQPQDGVSYYGVCRGDQMQLDVYQNGQFVGYQDGSIGSSGGGWGPGPWASAAAPSDRSDWGGPQPRFNRNWDDGRARFVSGSWVMFTPGYSSGQETWTRW
jgi:hypothetical protein